MKTKNLTKEELLKACQYAKKFFHDGFYIREPTWSSFCKCPLVVLPYSYTSPSGSKYEGAEFMFFFDKKTQTFVFTSYYTTMGIRLNENKSEEILKHLKQ